MDQQMRSVLQDPDDVRERSGSESVRGKGDLQRCYKSKTQSMVLPGRPVVVQARVRPLARPGAEIKENNLYLHMQGVWKILPESKVQKI